MKDCIFILLLEPYELFFLLLSFLEIILKRVGKDNLSDAEVLCPLLLVVVQQPSMLNNKSFDILLIYNLRQVFDDNRVVTRTVDDLITNLVVFAYAVDEILREEEIQ